MYRSLILLLFLLLTSCGKKTQNSFRLPEININQEKIVECTKLKINHETFNHDSAVAMFNCLSWDQRYPHLYQALQSIDPAKWNNFASSWNKTFWNSTEDINKTKKRWSKYRALEKDNAKVAEFIERYLNSPDKIHIPSIKSDGSQKVWLDALSHYDFIMELFKILEHWKKNYYNEHYTKKVKTVQFLASLVETSRHLSHIPLQKQHLYHKIQNVMVPNLNETSWILQWAYFFKDLGLAKDFRDALFLNSSNNKFFKILPDLKKLLDSGLLCQEKNARNASLKENYLEVTNSLPYLSKDDSYLEILDLKLKLLGLKEYCETLRQNNPMALAQYQVGLKSIYALEQILVTPYHYDVLKTLLGSLASQNLSLDDLLSFYAVDEINKIFLLWLNQLENETSLDTVMDILSTMSASTFDDIVRVALTTNSHSLIQKVGHDQDVLSQGWLLLLEFLQEDTGQFSPLLEFFMPQEVLYDLISRYQILDTEYVKNIFTYQPAIAQDLKQLLIDDQWAILLDLLLSGKTFEANTSSLKTPKAIQTNRAALPTIETRKNTLIQNCFWQISVLRPETLQSMVENFPNACLQMTIRPKMDFAFRVVSDLAKLNIYTKEKISQSLLDKWKILEKPMLNFIGDLMVAGEASFGGFSQYWQDLFVVFYSVPAQKFVENFFKKNWDNINSLTENKLQLPSIQGVAFLLPKLPQLYSLLAFLTVKDLSSNETSELQSLLDKDSFSIGRYIQYFEELASLHQVEQLESLLTHASIKNNRYLQIIVNDLATSGEPKRIVEYYEDQLQRILKSSTLQKILNLNEQEVQSLFFLKEDLKFLKTLSQKNFQGRVNHTFLKELVELLKPFATTSSFSWAGRSISLLLSKVHVSAGSKILVALSLKKSISKVGDYLLNQFSGVDRKKIITLFSEIKGIGLLWGKNIHFPKDEMEKLMQFLSLPSSQKSLERLAVYFSNPELDFTRLKKDLDNEFAKKLFKVFTSQDLLGFYHYYFSTYGDSLVKISQQANFALKEIYQ